MKENEAKIEVKKVFPLIKPAATTTPTKKREKLAAI